MDFRSNLVAELRAIQHKDERLIKLVSDIRKEKDDIRKEVEKNEKDSQLVEKKIQESCENSESIYWLNNLLEHELHDIDRINIAEYTLEIFPDIYNIIIQKSREEYEEIENKGYKDVEIDEEFTLRRTLDNLGSDLLRNHYVLSFRWRGKVLPTFMNFCSA